MRSNRYGSKGAAVEEEKFEIDPRFQTTLRWRTIVSEEGNPINIPVVARSKKTDDELMYLQN